MTTLLEQIADPAQLNEAWLRVRRNRGGPGGDGIGLRSFAAGLLPQLGRLAEDLRFGSYRPGPLRRVTVPKRRGGSRELAIPCVVDRVAQTSAAMVLQGLLEPEFEEGSYGYRPGRSVRMAVDRVSALRRQGYEWVVDADILSYFDNVPHGPLLARLARHVKEPAVLDLVAGWLQDFGPEGRGLAQGSPLSPLLANLYLDELDERIEGRGVRIVRFADDFLLLCRSQVKARGALERVAALLKELGLELHPEKTRIVSFEEGVHFLGKLFLRSVVVDSSRDDEPAEAEFDRVLPLPGALARGGPEAKPPGASAGAVPDPLPEEDTGPVVLPFPELAPAASGAETAPAIAEADDRFRPYIAPLYLYQPGRVLDLHNEAFAVLEDGEELLALPPGKLDRIELGPHAAITPAALRQALAYGVAVSLVDGHGRSQGLVEPVASRRAELHLAQARHILDPGRRLDLAARFVRGRLFNQRAQLRRWMRNDKRNGDPRLLAAVETLRVNLAKLKLAESVEQLAGYEGAGAAAYWPALGRCLDHGWRFATRRRHPARDAVNSLLDWLSYLLTRDVGALVLRHGLEPGLAVLHGVRDGRDSLALDLVEEFRAPLVEALAVYLFNNRILGRDDFFRQDDGAVRLGAEGRGDVIRNYERWLDREVKSPRRRRATTWRGLLDEQVQALVGHLLERAPYQPYALKH